MQLFDSVKENSSSNWHFFPRPVILLVRVLSLRFSSDMATLGLRQHVEVELQSKAFQPANGKATAVSARHHIDLHAQGISIDESNVFRNSSVPTLVRSVPVV